MIVWLSDAEYTGHQELNGIHITDVVYVLARPALMRSQYWRVQQHRPGQFAELQVDLSPFLMG
jgi:hypothetical protein